MPKLLKNIIIYFFGNIFARMISFFLLPIYTRFINPADFGYYDLVTSITGFVVPVFFIEIWNGILRLMYDYNNELDKRKVATNGLFFALLISVLFTAAYWSSSIFLDVRYSGWIFLYSILLMVQNIYQFSARGLGKNIVFVVSGIASSIVTVVLNVLLIVVYHQQLQALLISTCASILLSILVIELRVGLIFKARIKDIDFKIVREMLVFCLPLIINSASYWFLTSFNRVVIQNKLGLEYNGIFAVSSRFTTAIGIFVSVFSLAWQESAFSLSNTSERGKQYSNTLNIYIRFLFGGMLVLIPLTSLVFPYLVAHTYQDAKAILPIYYAGTIIGAISTFFGHIYGAEKRTKTIFITTLVGSIISIAVIFSFIPYMGLQAAGLSILLGFTATVIMRWIMIQKTVHVKMNISYILYFCLFYMIAFATYYKTGIIGNATALIVMTVFWLYTSKEPLLRLYGTLRLRFK